MLGFVTYFAVLLFGLVIVLAVELRHARRDAATLQRRLDEERRENGPFSRN